MSSFKYWHNWFINDCWLDINILHVIPKMLKKDEEKKTHEKMKDKTIFGILGITRIILIFSQQLYRLVILKFEGWHVNSIT